MPGRLCGRGLRSSPNPIPSRSCREGMGAPDLAARRLIIACSWPVCPPRYCGSGVSSSSLLSHVRRVICRYAAECRTREDIRMYVSASGMSSSLRACFGEPQVGLRPGPSLRDWVIATGGGFMARSRSCCAPTMRWFCSRISSVDASNSLWISLVRCRASRSVTPIISRRRCATVSLCWLIMTLNIAVAVDSASRSWAI